MGKLDKVPQPVREAIAAALMVGAVTATAAALLQQPLFLPGGAVLFLIFYIWRIHPQIKSHYEAEAQREYDEQYGDDATYQPILDRFAESHNEDAFFEQYHAWKQGPHDNQVRMRFLQTAILALIDAGCIYRVEELQADFEEIAKAEGLGERFDAFRANCDARIAEIAQQRLA